MLYTEIIPFAKNKLSFERGKVSGLNDCKWYKLIMVSFAQKQNYLFISLIILTALASIFSYRVFQEKWLILKKAENKFNQKLFAEAIVLYQKSLAKGPTTPRAFLHLADSYVAIGNFAEGIKYYRLYLEKHPQDTSVRLLLARALSWNGNIEEAEKEYQKVVEISDASRKK